MDNHNNYPRYYYGYGYTRDEGNYKNTNRPGHRETSGRKSDDDLIIEENTICEIDRECLERLKRNRKRLI